MTFPFPPSLLSRMAVRIVSHAFEIVHLLTDQNPIQVYVDAVVACGPREDSTRIGSQGASRWIGWAQRVRQELTEAECSQVPSGGRLSMSRPFVASTRPSRSSPSVYALVPRASVRESAHCMPAPQVRESSFRNVKSIAECLADEIINAAKGSSNSYAIKKKDELERVAKVRLCLKQTVLVHWLTYRSSRSPTVKKRLFLRGWEGARGERTRVCPKCICATKRPQWASVLFCPSEVREVVVSSGGRRDSVLAAAVRPSAVHRDVKLEGRARNSAGAIYFCWPLLRRRVGNHGERIIHLDISMTREVG